MKKKKGLLFFFFTLYILPQIYGLLFPEQILASPLVWKKSGNIDSYSQDLRVSPTNSNTIYATLRTGNLSGLYKSVDGGANFNPILPLITGRDVNSIAISSSSASFLWVSTYEQGVLKSIDDGNSWTTTSGILPKKTRYLTIDPTNENILYAGTGENNSDGGIYKSIDKGDTWNQVGASTYGYKNNLNIYVDKHNPNIVYAGSDFGLFRTINGGDAWENIFSNNTYPPATLVSITLGSTIYTSVPNQGIYKSTDNGLTWTLKNNTMGNSLIFRLAVDNNDTLYASRVISGGGVWRSKDGAETWENVGDSAWGDRSTWGLDVGGGRVFVGVEGLGIYYADTNSDQINPVVFIPGFLGSWSYKGLIENQPTTYTDWQLTPYFTESFYQPLLLTLKNANLTDSGPNQNLFTFAYDYRKSVADTAA